jgi:hypothetical protein
MNIVFNVRTVMASATFLALVVVPKIVNNLGANLGSVGFMLEMWWVFLVVLFALGLALWPYIKNWRTSLIVFIIAIIIAYIVAIAY